MNIFENANFSFCVFYFAIDCFLHLLNSAFEVVVKIFEKKASRAKVNKQCAKERVQLARLISQMWFRYAVHCVAAAVVVCIYWITYLQTSFFRFLLLSWECTIAMHQTSHGPYKKNIKWYSNKFSNVVIYYQCFCISLVRHVSLCGNGATSVS